MWPSFRQVFSWLVPPPPNEMRFPTSAWPELDEIVLGGKEWKPRQTKVSLGKPQGRMHLAGPQEGTGDGKWEIVRVLCLIALTLHTCFPLLFSLGNALQSPWWDVVTS